MHGVSKANQKKNRRQSRRAEPLKIEMTVVVNVGDEPHDRIVLMNDRELKLVGSIFRYRNQIQRYVINGLLRVAVASPTALREFLPGLALLRRKRSPQ